MLVLFIAGIVIGNIDHILPNEVSAIKQQGTLEIKDSKTHQVETVHYEASGKCYKVIDGDTFWVEGVGKVRFVGVNTPERGEAGYSEAKNFVKEKCLGKTVYLDIDNAKNKDKYNRTLAIVYVDDINLNQELLVKNYAEVMFIPPSEFPKGLNT